MCDEDERGSEGVHEYVCRGMRREECVCARARRHKQQRASKGARLVVRGQRDESKRGSRVSVVKEKTREKL